MAFATKAWAMFLLNGVGAVQIVTDLFSQSRGFKGDNAWCHNWLGMFLHETKRDSRDAEVEIKEAIRCNPRIPPFYRNLARVILEKNVSPFLRSRNQEVIRLCDKGLLLCPAESYWNWGGLRADIEALRYTARSMQGSDLPDRTSLVGSGDFEGED